METNEKIHLNSFLCVLRVLCVERAAAVAMLMAALASSGCLVVALQPAYDDQSLVFDEALLGQWENSEDGDRATIERGEWRSYKITFGGRMATRSFQGNLTKIATTTILDVTEMRGADPGPYLEPVHGLVRVSIEHDTMTAALLDYDWFMRAMARRSLGPIAAAIDDRRNAVITSSTSDMRRWLMRAPPEAFQAPATFVRKP